jgi:hypothetical protein
MKSLLNRRAAQARPRRGGIARAVSALALAGLFAAACGDPSGPEQLTTLTISPATATVAVNGTVQFAAAGTRAGTSVTTIKGETWTVAGGGTVSTAGLFTAPSTPGTSTITVTCGGKSAVATVTVVAGPLATITVTPNPATLAIGAQQQFTAVGKDAAGNVVPITPVWSTTNPPGTINAGTGLFTAGNTAGTFANSVRATSGAIFGTATVIVTPGAPATITVTPNPATLAIGAQQQFTAVARDAGGNVVPITPVWSTTNPPGTINASTGLFTAGNTAGTFANSVTATAGSLSGTATVIVTPGPLATITVTPNPVTLMQGDVQTFTAVGRDAGGNVVAINPTWSVTSGGGTIPAGTTGPTAPFTAGNTNGTFTNTVRATQGAIFGTATVIVTSPPVIPPLPTPSSTFRVLANVAVACTSGSISGDVGTFQAGPTGSFTPVNCPVTNGTAQVGTTASKQAYNDFVAAYNAFKTEPCGTVLIGTLAGVTLPPGVYCFDNAATLTGTLTLNGPATGVWLFKVGTSGVGALTATNFSVVLAGGASACNVTWWTEDAGTMTDTNMRGAILAGGDITSTRGTLNGNLWSQGDVTITGTALSACSAPAPGLRARARR